ncbi:exosortase Y [Mucilaginibacter sp. BT774]|uniref:exosortase Y n=1 Tax=Mucilaginibacter sp. BT774 TaxID=3062276 RepID=UPI0026768A2E|nr:archaeosortase/exosortase family protein [Mucilaginibacter sp. BT774]MDO3627482.1 archaeosortase/exosortase family protein [Mucilaginibacter sp. BT774]
MKRLHKDSPLRFLLVFLALFLFFYYFNIFFFSVTSHGEYYFAFFDEHLNYIRLLRRLLLLTSQFIINLFGYTAISNDFQLLVAGHRTLDVVYSCLGLGVMSFFAAFVIAYPKSTKPKLIFLFTGLISIQVLNVLRFVLLGIFWDKKSHLIIDHHTIFNIVIYVIIAIGLFFWVKHDDKQPKARKSIQN